MNRPAKLEAEETHFSLTSFYLKTSRHTRRISLDSMQNPRENVDIENTTFWFFSSYHILFIQSFNYPSCNISKIIAFLFSFKPSIFLFWDTKHMKGLAVFICVFIYLVKRKTEKESLSSPFTAVIREK